MHHNLPFSSQISSMNPQFPENEHLNCPRCDSSNTKFCYYNNYNLSQPRHYCKNCRRYWTKGGTLRNIPVGGGVRKINKRSTVSNKRPADSSPPTSPATAISSPSPSPSPPLTSELKAESLGNLGYGDGNRMELDCGSSDLVMRLNQGMQFGSFVDGLRSSLGGGSEEVDGLIGRNLVIGGFEKKNLSLNDDLIGRTPAIGLSLNDDLIGRTPATGLSLNDDLIGTPATGLSLNDDRIGRTPATGGFEKKNLSLNDDDNEGGSGGGGGGGGGGSGGGNGWPNLSIFTPGSNLH